MHEVNDPLALTKRHSPRSEDPIVKTLIALENSNCTWCHSEMLGTLRDKEGVRGVQSDFSSGCLVIEHEDDPDALLSLVTTADRAVVVASNGEREMAPVAGHEADACRGEKVIVRALPGGKGSAPTSARSPGAKASSTRCLSDRGSPAAMVCPVCHPEGGGGRDGVRVITRKRPTSDPVLRAVRFVVRKRPVAVHLSMTPDSRPTGGGPRRSATSGALSRLPCTRTGSSTGTR